MDSSPNGRGEGNQNTSNSAAQPTGTVPEEPSEPGQKKARTRFWVVFGKVSLVLGTLWVVINLWGWVFPKGPRLEAKCEIVNKATPPIDDELDARMSSLLGSKTFEDVKKILDNDKVFSGRLAQVRTDALTNQLRESIVLPEADFLVRMRKMDRLSLMACRITNTGNQTAHQTILDLSFKPRFATMNNEVIPIEKLSNSLSIGDVRPGVPVTLRMWSDQLLFEEFQDVRVTDQTGTGKIDFGLLTYGMTEKAVRLARDFGEVPAFLASALLFIGLLALFLIRMLRAIGSGQRPTGGTHGEEPPA